MSSRTNGASGPHRMKEQRRTGDRAETVESIRPLVDILLAAGHADDEFCDREEATVRSLVEQLLRVDVLPEEIEAQIASFDPEGFDLGASTAAFREQSATTGRRLVELVREVVDANHALDIDEDRYVMALVLALSLAPEEVKDLLIEDAPGLMGPVKRVFDILFSSAFLVAAGPVMLAIAAAVKLTSPGPALFKQRRYGIGGKEIEVFKFRTMRVMEDGAEVKQATKHDSRITPLGAFLRRTSLDELPQFLNVLRGDMSVVGPRPHAVAHNEAYRTQILEYMLRHKVKPGITGWAQVNGWRGETDTLMKMIHRIDHDLDYIRDWTLYFDLKIIWLTIFGKKVRQNAY